MVLPLLVQAGALPLANGHAKGAQRHLHPQRTRRRVHMDSDVPTAVIGGDLTGGTDPNPYSIMETLC